MELLRLKCPGCHSSDIQSGDSSELAARLPCKGKRGEKPWCLPDNALPSDTPQLAAGRLHLVFDLVPIGRLTQVFQQMTQPVVTKIQRLDGLGSQAAQGVVHAF